MICPDPKFRWNERRGHYEACSRCGRVAWEHEQSDPLADVQHEMARIREGREHERPHPPVMKGG